MKAILESAIGGRIRIDAATGQIMARGALTDIDRTTFIMAVESAGGREKRLDGSLRPQDTRRASRNANCR